MPSTKAGSILRVICAFLVPVLLVTSTIRWFVNQPHIYGYAVHDFGAAERIGISHEQLDDATRELREYLTSGDRRLDATLDQDGSVAPFFSPRETAHLEDVKQRLTWMNRVQEAGIVMLAVSIGWAFWRHYPQRAIVKGLASGAVLTVVLIGLAGVFALAGFDRAWADFHEVLFSGNWQFSLLSDRLIQIFPPAFWERMVLFIGLAVSAESLVLLLFTWVWSRWTKRAQADGPDAA